MSITNLEQRLCDFAHERKTYFPTSLTVSCIVAPCVTGVSSLLGLQPRHERLPSESRCCFHFLILGSFKHLHGSTQIPYNAWREDDCGELVVGASAAEVHLAQIEKKPGEADGYCSAVRVIRRNIPARLEEYEPWY